MRQYLKKKWKLLENSVLPKGLVLMYHRVAHVNNDPWDLVVSPEHFTEQLEVLGHYAKVLPLQTLSEMVFNHTLKGKAVAITFDDGYGDNYYNARPCLQACGFHATFFIVSGMINSRREFWWDDLERLLLGPGRLPEVFQSVRYPEFHGYPLEKSAILSRDDYENYRHWKAWEKAPTPRHALYFELWKSLKFMPRTAQADRMDEIAQWAGNALGYRDGYLPMRRQELTELGQQDLFQLGAHTHYHAHLSGQNKNMQSEEIIDGADVLERLTHKKATCFSYPYGAFDRETIDVVKGAGFSYAVTTEERVFTKNAAPWAIPRFQVKNWDGDTFKEKLSYWIKQF